MNAEELNLEVRRMIKDGLEKKSIFRRLESNGMNLEMVEEAYEEARVFYDFEFRKKNRLISSVILVVLLASILLLIPITSTGKSPYLYGILMGIILGAVVLQLIESFRSFQDFIDGFSSDSTGRKIHTHPLLFIAFPIVFSIGLVFFFRWEVRHEIDTYGVNTIGRIMDGYSQTNSTQQTSATSNKILIWFSTKEGVEIEEQLSVTDSQFDNTHIGQDIQVRYSARHPEFFDVNIPEPGKESVEEFMP